MVRKSGKRTKGPKPFTAEDKEKFRRSLKVLSHVKNEPSICKKNFVK